MAFTLEVLRGATTYNISAGQVISIADVDDLGGASVRNQEEQGSYQDGSSHLGFRLEPRTFTLRLNVVGATASALDGYRDTLNAMFKPVRNVPIILKLTRDDGEVRQLDCQRTGPLTIPLRKEDHPGHLHRSVVQLRAADPTLYNPTEQQEDFVTASSSWWLAYDTISTGNVMEHVENPTQGQSWAHSGSVAAGGAYSIVVRSAGTATPAGPGSIPYAFHLSNSSGDIAYGARLDLGGGVVTSGTVGIVNAAQLPGTTNYYLIHNGGTMSFYRGTVLFNAGTGISAPIQGTAAGTARWRSDYVNFAASRWTPELPNAAIYNIALNDTQRLALDQALSAGSAQSGTIPYVGDYDSYPVITLRGPINDPVITNTTLGVTLDFTGGTVGSGDVWTIDTRYGYKSALSGTVSVEQYLSDDSDLATFRLAPDPIATGGTNLITVTSGSAGSASEISLSYYNRYMSF